MLHDTLQAFTFILMFFLSGTLTGFVFALAPLRHGKDMSFPHLVAGGICGFISMVLLAAILDVLISTIAK